MAEISSPILGMRVRRNMIPANAIMGRPEQPVQDPETVAALRRNQMALQGVNLSLANVTNQIAGLNNSFQAISAQIEQSRILEQAQQRQKDNQERILASQRIREGKEGLIEKRIQSALAAPLQKIGGKAQKSLFNLGRFFQILIGGALGARILKVVGDLSSEGKLSLGNLFDRIKKDLAIVTAIFIGLNGGFVLALRTLGALTARLGGFALRNFLLRPIQAAFTLAGGILSGIVNKIRGLPQVPGTTPGGRPTSGGRPNPPSGQQTTTPGGRPTSPTPPTRGNIGTRLLRGLTGGTGIAGLNFLFGAPLDQSILAGGGASLGGKIGFGLGMLTGPASPIMAPLLGLAGGFGGSFLFPELYRQSGIQVPGGDTTLSDLVGGDLSTLISGATKSEADLKRDEQRVNNLIVNAGGGQGQVEETSTSGGSGTGNNIVFIPSTNSDNPYMMHSYIQYNVGGIGI
mgnify:CR=1 FL=1